MAQSDLVTATLLTTASVMATATACPPQPCYLPLLGAMHAFSRTWLLD